MKIAILSANLGNFDTPVDPVAQDLPPGVEKIVFHRYTDANFPPIMGLTPRFQYRIPKLFGWQMTPGFDIYIWVDGALSLLQPDSTSWLLGKLGTAEMAFFKHPWRNTMQAETDLIEQKLRQKQRYITSRYQNGLHREQLAVCLADPGFKDTVLYTSTVFVYRNTWKVHDALQLWWQYQSRYFTCDQIVLPYILFKKKIKVSTISENQYEIKYLSLVSRH